MDISNVWNTAKKQISDAFDVAAGDITSMHSQIKNVFQWKKLADVTVTGDDVRAVSIELSDDIKNYNEVKLLFWVPDELSGWGFYPDVYIGTGVTEDEFMSFSSVGNGTSKTVSIDRFDEDIGAVFNCNHNNPVPDEANNLYIIVPTAKNENPIHNGTRIFVLVR